MSPPERRRGDTGAFREHPCLHRDKPCAMKTIFQQFGIYQQQYLRSACA